MLYEHTGDSIKKQVESGKLSVLTPQPETFPWWVSMLPSIIILVIMIGFAIMMFRQSGGGGRGTMNFGKSRARIHDSGKTGVTFKDVAGADAEKYTPEDEK